MERAFRKQLPAPEKRRQGRAESYFQSGCSGVRGGLFEGTASHEQNITLKS